MPTVSEKLIDALASCTDGRCAGYKQQPVKALETLTEFSYFDLGGDVPGIERSTTLLRFADEADIACPFCAEPRLVADQVRPIYPNISGVPQDRLLHMHDADQRMRDMQLANSQRETEMAQMRELMQRQASALERQELQIKQLGDELASRPRGPGRPRKVDE